MTTDRVKFTAEDFELANYNYELPDELIATRPAQSRELSRLLVSHGDNVHHGQFKDLLSFLPPYSTLVFNQSKVFPCRLFGARPSGGQVEVFILSLNPVDGAFEAMIKASGTRKVGESFIFEGLTLELAKIGEGTFWVKPSVPDFPGHLERHAGIPIPPYIRDGIADEKDKEDYQTVYAKVAGSVAAPTAGLHFTPGMLDELKAQGHEVAFVTLHVGLGTFRPVKSADIREHKMHAETFSVDAENAAIIARAKQVVAVGTTTLRVLESCFREGKFIFPGEWDSTQIFLHPGVSVRSIQGLITNFHLPQSSLMMLVSALIGRKKLLQLYGEAISRRYRFFSYGDAMYLKLQ